MPKAPGKIRRKLGSALQKASEWRVKQVRARASRLSAEESLYSENAAQSARDKAARVARRHTTGWIGKSIRRIKEGKRK